MQRELGRSVVRTIPGTEPRSFPSFSDFAARLINAGTIRSEQELSDTRADLLSGILFEWYRQGQIACVFARRLACSPDANNWTSIVVQGDSSPEILDVVLETASTELQALQLIFPGSGLPDQAVRLINSLCSHSS